MISLPLLITYFFCTICFCMPPTDWMGCPFSTGSLFQHYRLYEYLFTVDQEEDNIALEVLSVHGRFLLVCCLYCARNVLCAPHCIDPMFLVLLFCPLSSLYQFPQTLPPWSHPHWKRQWQRASTRATSCTAQRRWGSTCNSHATWLQHMTVQ